MITDPTWDNVGVAILSCIELNTAIICPCLPTLKPLISRHFPRLLSPSKPCRCHHHQHGCGVDAQQSDANSTKSRSSEQRHSTSKRTPRDSRSSNGGLGTLESFDLEDLEAHAVSASSEGDKATIRIGIHEPPGGDSLAAPPQLRSEFEE
jgi:hypothetical protein